MKIYPDAHKGLARAEVYRIKDETSHFIFG
jgi:hypothetical protein